MTLTMWVQELRRLLGERFAIALEIFDLEKNYAEGVTPEMLVEDLGTVTARFD